MSTNRLWPKAGCLHCPPERAQIDGALKQKVPWDGGAIKAAEEMRADRVTVLNASETSLEVADKANSAADVLTGGPKNQLTKKGVTKVLKEGAEKLGKEGAGQVARQVARAGGRQITKVAAEIRNMTLKGWSKGKGATHFAKHGRGMGFANVKEYTDAAKALATKAKNVVEGKV